MWSMKLIMWQERSWGHVIMIMMCCKPITEQFSLIAKKRQGGKTCGWVYGYEYYWIKLKQHILKNV